VYSASIDNRGDSKYHASTGAFGFVMDTDGQGVSPAGALLASLCACLGHYVRDFLGEQKLAYSSFAVMAKAEAAEDGPRLGEISVVIALRGAELDALRQSALLTYVERCMIFNTLSANSRIVKTLQFD
jgi:uncharacterized OsmC-like protein